jgi:hypothetical protein
MIELVDYAQGVVARTLGLTMLFIFCALFVAAEFYLASKGNQVLNRYLNWGRFADEEPAQSEG